MLSRGVRVGMSSGEMGVMAGPPALLALLSWTMVTMLPLPVPMSAPPKLVPASTDVSMGWALAAARPGAAMDERMTNKGKRAWAWGAVEGRGRIVAAVAWQLRSEKHKISI